MRSIQGVVLHPRTKRFIVSRLPLVFVYVTKLICNNVRNVPLNNVTAIVTLFLFLILLCHFVYLHQVYCQINGRRLIYRQKLFYHEISCVRLCHVISFRRRRDLLRRLYNLGAIIVLSASQGDPGLSLVNVQHKGSVITVVHRHIRVGGQGGKVCRVAGR